MMRSCKKQTASQTMLNSRWNVSKPISVQRRQEHGINITSDTNREPSQYLRIPSIGRRLILPATLRSLMNGVLINWTASHECCLSTPASSMRRRVGISRRPYQKESLKLVRLWEQSRSRKVFLGSGCSLPRQLYRNFSPSRGTKRSCIVSHRAFFSSAFGTGSYHTQQ